MTAPTDQLPPIGRIASLNMRSQIAYAIRCAERAAPLYASKNPDPGRAQFVEECIEIAKHYFETGKFQPPKEYPYFDAPFQDYGVNTATFAAMAAEDAFNEKNDPDYDAEEREDDEATPSHRVEHAASFSLLAAYDTNTPLEKARSSERIILAATLADFAYLEQIRRLETISEIGPLWQDECLDDFDDRLAAHRALVRD